MRRAHAWWLLGILVAIGACAHGSDLGDDAGGTGGQGGSSGTPGASGNGSGAGSGSGNSSGSGSSGAAGAGGATATTSAAAGTGGMAASSSSAASNAASSNAASSNAASSSAASSSASGGPVCPGTVVDWNWNLGTAPANLTFFGSSWAVGNATNGPSDSLPYLATGPGTHYPDNANDWVRLPMIDLSAVQACQLRVTVELWRNAEKFGLVNYDGGNLQYTTDPGGNSGWDVLDGASMDYDGKLPQCGAACIVKGQKTWTTSTNPKAKTAVYEAAAPPGAALTLRFTFFSDAGNNNGPLPGIFIRRVWVEAF